MIPSIKLNIFRKLEYFFTLQKLNSQFKSQLDILKERTWQEQEHRYQGNYPTWEIEKKILFWTYAYHKHLGHGITPEHFSKMFISEKEADKVDGYGLIFENLESRGFGELVNDKCKITKEGLAFGELLWSLYTIKRFKKNTSGTKPEDYSGIYQADYRLKASFWGFLILYLQIISFYLLTILAVGLLITELLEKIGLLQNFTNWFAKLSMSSSAYWIMIISLPFFTFIASIIIDRLYDLFCVKRKDKKIERLRNSK